MLQHQIMEILRLSQNKVHIGDIQRVTKTKRPTLMYNIRKLIEMGMIVKDGQFYSKK